jgi:DNA-binding transcriptional LysR family regulator
MARRILAAVRGAHEVVAETEGLLRGTVCVGTSVALPAHVDFPGVIARFRQEHPGVQLRLRRDSATAMYDDLRSGAIDLALMTWPGRTPKGITTRPIARSTMLVACDASCDLASCREIALAALSDETFIDFNGDSAIRRVVERAFESAGVERNVAIRVNDVAMLLRLVERGVGIAIVPCAFRDCPARVHYLDIASPHICWNLVAAFVGDRPASAAVQALLEMLPRLDGAAG